MGPFLPCLKSTNTEITEVTILSENSPLKNWSYSRYRKGRTSYTQKETDKHRTLDKESFHWSERSHTIPAITNHKKKMNFLGEQKLQRGIDDEGRYSYALSKGLLHIVSYTN